MVFDLAVQAIKDEHKKQANEDMLDEEYRFDNFLVVDDGSFEALVVIDIGWLGYGGGSNLAVVYFRYNVENEPEVKHVVQYIEGERPHITDLFDAK
jgi:hypothetical protein